MNKIVIPNIYPPLTPSQIAAFIARRKLEEEARQYGVKKNK